MSQTANSTQVSMDQSSAQHLAANYNRLAFLVDISEPFAYEDLPEYIAPGDLRGWYRDSIVRVVSEERDDGERGKLWRLSEHARARLEEIAAQNQAGPCSHRGITNLGDVYSCTFDECGVRFDRETAKAIVQGENA